MSHHRRTLSRHWTRSSGLAVAAAAIILVSCARRTPAAPAEDEQYAAARKQMVAEQLKGRDITDARVLAAMGEVPRHAFVPEDQRAYAYDDTSLPIGYKQTITQPYIVARMTQELQPKPTDRVLEVGTGSGYQAAVLSKLVSEVYTIEIIAPLAKRAEATIRQLGYNNVHVRIGDGYLGWPEKAPFDSIIVTCAPEKVPLPLVDQLKEGGRMIIPVGDRYVQKLYLLTKVNGKVEQKAVLPVFFVPMTGERAERDHTSQEQH